MKGETGMYIALTRAVSPLITKCELTHLDRVPIDYERTQKEHTQYEQTLAELGCRIEHVKPEPELPDGVFVEDAAIVLDEIAIITRPGTDSRRPETATIADALAPFRKLAHINPPGQIEGGDVLLIGKDLFIGISSRTNEAGLEQVREIVKPYGYHVTSVPVTGCLHLKSAVTQVTEETLLINRRWIDSSAFAGFRMIDVDDDEPSGANALMLDETVVYPSGFPATQDKLEREGISLRLIDVTELRKAEAGVTCCSLIFRE